MVVDSESNGRNFSSLEQPGGEKKIIFNFFKSPQTVCFYLPFEHM